MSDPLSVGRLQEDIQNDFGLEVTRLRALRKYQGWNQLYSGKLHGEEVVVRLAVVRDTCPLDVWVYGQFMRLGVPAPRILAYHQHPPRIGYPTIIMSKLPGQWLDTDGIPAEAERAIYYQIGQLVRRMHELTIPGFGQLTLVGEEVAGRHNSWQAFVRALPRDRVIRYLHGHRLITDDEDRLIQSLNRLDEIRLDQAVFVHGDLHQRNILVDEDRLTGFVDVESGMAGDPRLDIAIASIWQTNHQRQAFAAGYGCLAQDPWITCYRIWVAARKLVWRHHSGLAAGTEHARQALIQALHEPWSTADEQTI